MGDGLITTKESFSWNLVLRCVTEHDNQDDKVSSHEAIAKYSGGVQSVCEHIPITLPISHDYHYPSYYDFPTCTWILWIYVYVYLQLISKIHYVAVVSCCMKVYLFEMLNFSRMQHNVGLLFNQENCIFNHKYFSKVTPWFMQQTLKICTTQKNSVICIGMYGYMSDMTSKMLLPLCDNACDKACLCPCCQGPIAQKHTHNGVKQCCKWWVRQITLVSLF